MYFKLSAILCLLIISVSCKKDPAEPQWRELFNGEDLTGWETYLGPRYSEDKKDFDGEAVGLNNDPRNVFSVVEEDGLPVIRISGEEFGCMATLDSFSNYHLQVQFKWGEGKYKPRDQAKRDSGILYHSRGDHGAEWYFWMYSQEMQVQEDDCGDYWSLGSEVDVRASMNEDSTYTYDPSQDLKHFGRHSEIYGVYVKKFPDGMEKANGEWNTLDLYTIGQKSMHVVNGTLVMVLENSREIIEDQVKPVIGGKIQIQSEGAEVFYKDIKIRSIETFPEQFGI